MAGELNYDYCVFSFWEGVATTGIRAAECKQKANQRKLLDYVLWSARILSKCFVINIKCLLI